MKVPSPIKMTNIIERPQEDLCVTNAVTNLIIIKDKCNVTSNKYPNVLKPYNLSKMKVCKYSEKDLNKIK